MFRHFIKIARTRINPQKFRFTLSGVILAPLSKKCIEDIFDIEQANLTFQSDFHDVYKFCAMADEDLNPGDLIRVIRYDLLKNSPVANHPRIAIMKILFMAIYTEDDLKEIDQVYYASLEKHGNKGLAWHDAFQQIKHIHNRYAEKLVADVIKECVDPGNE